MRKLKIPLLILLTLLLLIVGASLPEIAAAVQDNATVNNSGYSDMESLKLDFSGERQYLPMIQKLSSLSGGLYSISEDQTVMTQSVVREVVERELAPYYEWKLIPYTWKNVSFAATPYLAYGPDNEETYSIFWEVAIYCNEENSFSLNLYVDDETGKILFLHFNAAWPLEIYDRQDYLDLFCGIYFESLGMTESAQYWEENGLVEDISTNPEDSPAVRYTFGDAVYGEISIDFYAYPNGFYNYFPS